MVGQSGCSRTSRLYALDLGHAGGNTSLVLLLISAGADVNVTESTQNGSGPLLHAARGCKVDIFKLLLGRGLFAHGASESCP